jgi:zinc protease
MPATEVTRCQQLNRNTKSRRAKLSFVETIPFGSELELNRYRMGNGLNILMLEDHSAPVVSFHSWFRVGSRHETPGKTGLAHLFEHLMFNETKKHPAGEFDRLLENAGGESNAATWTDWTYYYENLPSTELELAVELESDRLANLVLKKPQVTSEKEVVKNERVYRVDDDVDGTADEQLYKLAFQDHPYHWPTIGWMEDIESFSIKDCESFYRRFYAPNNASIIICGSFDPTECLGLLQTHYGSISSSKLPKETARKEKAATRERRLTLNLPTPTEKVLVGYRAPAFGDEDYVVLTVLNEILFGGRSSRAHRHLVNETELALSCRASIAPFRDPGLYDISLTMREGMDRKKAMKLLEAELDRAKNELVTEDELEKAKNRIELSFLHGMETASGKAEQIGFFETVIGDPGSIFSRVEFTRKVQAKDLMRVAKKYFRKSQRTIVTILPKAGS